VAMSRDSSVGTG